MDFANAMINESTKTYTENGAKAFNTTTDALVDLFAICGAMRNRSEREIINKFEAAFRENALLATKMLFYIGNIRGGLGERRTFRICLKWLANKHPGVVLKNIHYIAFFNRWDSIFELINTPIENSMWSLVHATLLNDIGTVVKCVVNNEQPQISLLAKWLPSENASSKKTRKLARYAISKLELSPKNYRKMLSTLRRVLKIVERDMSLNQWDNIYYPGVPSYAMKNYFTAFMKHSEERFNQYLEQLKNNKTTINSKVLFPSDLVRDYWNINRCKDTNDVLEQQWKNLPNFISGENNIVVMADVSGSMSMCSGFKPIYSAIGLAIYFAQRNKGAYHNLFMTFSEKPYFMKLDENGDLKDAINKVMHSCWNMNTDLNLAMKTILKVAKENNISPEEMPKALCVITDMEIDEYDTWSDKSFISWDYSQNLKNIFEEAGYALPKLVFWNVNSKKDTYLTKDEGTILVSGHSTSIFKTVINNLDQTAYNTMLNVLNDSMYDCITI